jgi:tetratricopeptide (TPR) repeat protein
MIATAVCNTYLELGANAYRQGYTDVAEKMLNAALEEAQRLGSKQYPPCAVFNRLAHMYYQQKNYEKAEHVYEQALVMYERIFDDGDANLSGMMLNLAELYFSQRKYEKAEPLYRRALDATNVDSSIVEKCALKLAWIYANHHRFDEAQKLYARVQAFRDSQKQSPRILQTAETA